MCKFLTSLLVLLTTVSVIASASPCWDGIVAAKKRDNPSAKQIECIDQNQEVQVSLIGLCSADQRDFSAKYQAYRSYEIPFDETFQKFQTATDNSVKVRLQMKMRTIERDWRIFGFKDEINRFLAPIESAIFKCEKN